MTERTSDTIDELARLAFDVARPTSFKAHAVERVFRESVKAITGPGTTQPSRQDCKHYVSGRIQKLIDRSEQIYPIAEEKSTYGGNFGERVDRYAEFFVDRLLFDLCDGKPSRLKRLSNNFSDGFYAATLQLIRDESADDEDAPSAADQTEAEDN